MKEQTTRTTIRPRGSNRRAPALPSLSSTNSRSRGDKANIPCCRLQAQGSSAHLLPHHSGYK
ncbi:hypothetical protein Hanom_Chr15g01409121 [Helianthus anomalus]